MPEPSDDEDGWNSVVLLPTTKSASNKKDMDSSKEGKGVDGNNTSQKTLLKKRKPFSTTNRYPCKYGVECRRRKVKEHTKKYSHTIPKDTTTAPPHKKMKQTTLTPFLETDDEKTLEMDAIDIYLFQKEEEDDGFRLEKEEIRQLSEKSFSAEFSPDDSLSEQDIQPPVIVISKKLPDTYTDYWDRKHVKLPCSPKNVYRRKNKPNRFLSRWYLIQNVYSSDSITCSKELEEAIRSYQGSGSRNWEWSGMHAFFRDSLTFQERKRFFTFTLPHIITMALRLPELFPQGIPLLLPGETCELSFSQVQLACLLANGFLCTFPSRQGQATKEEHYEGPSVLYQQFNFKNLFTGYGDTISDSQAAKWICILTYFQRIIEEAPKHHVTFLRRYVKPEKCIRWRDSTSTFTDIHISDDGFIEDESDSLQVDFANKMIGGGVLGNGCVQEEIRFIISPELLCSLLFTAELQDTECLVIKGSERFCNYTGYASSFDYGGPYYDKASVDSKNRLETYVVGVDALYFGRKGMKSQFTCSNIKRELNKAFCGFAKNSLEDRLVPLATGNWGCGVFGGHLLLKGILQLMVAAQVGRTVKYFTFHEKGVKDSLLSIHRFFTENGITVGQVYKALVVFSRIVHGKKITNDTQEGSEEIQNDLRAFGLGKSPDVVGFLRYFFSLEQPDVEQPEIEQADVEQAEEGQKEKKKEDHRLELEEDTAEKIEHSDTAAVIEKVQEAK